ncbi:MAG: lipid-A-disaccharide synthase [Planctomycetes bacterium]|nr:lipid-A-disaccharide synthase [Planctomycetota bacterium]
MSGPGIITDRPVTIFLSAAEASGDTHAAKLIQSLRKLAPAASFIGLAGPLMAAEGCEVLADLTARASMVFGPLLKFDYYLANIRRMKAAIRKIRPDIFIPVDSPALNWHLAGRAKQSGSVVAYYIAPQVWAWATWRAGKLARLADCVACILPFEQEYLSARGVRSVQYVGHPLFDSVSPRPAQLPDIAQAAATGNWRVALVPGSRESEIAHHSPAMAAVARAIRRRWPGATCTFTARTDACAAAIRRHCPDAADIQIATGRTKQVMAESHFAVVKSGTITLDAAYLGLPMVIIYRTNRIAYKLLARSLIRTQRFSLVNILAGRPVVPELMPWFGDIGQLTSAVLNAMQDAPRLTEIRQALLELVKPLIVSPPDSACLRAAALILNTWKNLRTA